jgi:hypothetical protein
MRHSFRLWQELLGISVASAIVEAMHRWPMAAAAGEQVVSPESS